MNKLICPKCGGEISNQFNATLSFCTNCGESLNIQAEKTLALSQTAETPKSQFSVILLTSLFTSVFLLTIAGVVGFYLFFSGSSTENPEVQSDTKTTPTPRKRQTSSISAADISEISLTYFRHEGLMYGGEKNRSTSNRADFKSDGSAYKIDAEINYENGVKVGQKSTIYKGTITKEQFEELAKVLIENDFVNESNAKDNITDSSTYTLKIKYSGNEKVIITSNTGKDTPEINTSLEAFKKLQNQVELKEVK